MLKPSDIGGFLVAVLIALAIGAIVVWRVTDRPAKAPPAPPPPVAAAPAGCDAAGRRDAMQTNARSLSELDWTPFAGPERGWATYAPLVAREVGTACPPGSARFAERLAAWQARHGRPADGVFRPEDFAVMKTASALRRPFVQRTAQGVCPAPPPASALATARPDEAYGGKSVQLRAGALAAYRRMVAAARVAGVAGQGSSLALVSGYRGPGEEAARCALGGCDTVSRARCSAHRTGLALDLYLDPAPGHDPISTDPANRAHQAATPAYRWLVANADRFGFLPYAYEPWHWEWTGEAP